MTGKQLKQSLVFNIFRLISLSVVAILFVILGFIVTRGIKVVNWEFLTSMPKDQMTHGGIYPAIIGTLCLIAGSMVFAFPIGVMSAIYMNEYLKESFLKKFIRTMTNNLAGIPSIVFGLFGIFRCKITHFLDLFNDQILFLYPSYFLLYRIQINFNQNAR